MKLLGYRSKTGWKMGLATFVYGFILLFIVIAIIDPSSEEIASESIEAEETETEEEEATETIADVEEEPVEEVEPVEEESTEDGSTFGSGMVTIEEIEPGLYKGEGSFNYWERLAGFSGELDDIIANGNPQGTTYVEILDTDAGFNSMGSGTWTKVEEDYEGELLTSFEDGMYIVGKDIEPGTYKSEGGNGMGYWARLSGFSGDLDSIIANGNPDGSTIVEISSSDVGFETHGAGTWTKVE